LPTIVVGGVSSIYSTMQSNNKDTKHKRKKLKHKNPKHKPIP
jgi:hypothetical protein